VTVSLSRLSSCSSPRTTPGKQVRRFASCALAIQVYLGWRHKSNPARYTTNFSPCCTGTNQTQLGEPAARNIRP
jgi:hypothetical protein